MKIWLNMLATGAILMAPGRPPSSFPLDVAGGVGGIRFGESATQIVGFGEAFRKKGKPRLATQLYVRRDDTTLLGGIGHPTDYWFRQNKFIGVEKNLYSNEDIQKALEQFTAQYGPPRPDTLPNQWYWLGQHSFVFLSKDGRRSGSLSISSLAMLNEQIHETALRAQARRQLGWRPDSVGLPRQYPVRLR